MPKTIDAFELYPQAAWDLADSLNITRSLTMKERDKIDDSDFAWPDAPDHPKYPIDSQDHLDAAAKLIGRAPENKQAEIKARAIRIAKRKGFTLPDSWQEEKEEDRTHTPVIVRADGNHEPTAETHTHPHPAYSSQGDDATHEHEHTHSNDNSHEHSHDEKKANIPDIMRTMPTETSIFAPILRIDRARREIVLRATAEALDSYGTVIGFEGSKEAFSKWRGNIREMHDPTRAVGKAIKWEPVDEEKAIDITLRVSKGAEDTWQKCLDGTLAGGSIGARNGTWGKREWQGKEVPFLERYDLVEVSLVDNPSCPGCDVKIVRADGMATDVLDFSEETQPVQPTSPDITRIGARVSADMRTSLHKARDHAMQGARSAMDSCNCAECQAALKCLDPDMDGDIDIIPGLDMDGDGAGGDGSGTGVMNAATAEIIRAEIARQMAPTILRMNGIAARFASTDTPTIQPFDDTSITRRFDALEARLPELASSTELAEVRSLLSEVRELATGVKSLTEQIAATPQQGGPIVNSAALRAAPAYVPADPISEEAAVITRLAKAGILNKNQQINAALYLQNARQGQQSGR